MGPGHPSVCDSLLPLARLLRRKGRSSEALAMLQQQLRFLEDAGLGTSKGESPVYICNPPCHANSCCSSTNACKTEPVGA